jgi:hypothetical protein
MKVTIKAELKRDRDYITQNTPFLEYSYTELKMLGTSKALLISEPKNTLRRSDKSNTLPGIPRSKKKRSL